MGRQAVLEKRRIEDDITIERMEVTQQQAIKWLEGNVHNRPIRQTHVDGLVAEIKAGGWKLTNDAIVFSPEGVLLNGQHRLYALIEADRPLDFFVAYNVPKENQLVMDTGTVRIAADRYLLAGTEGVTRQHVATARKMVGWERTRRWTDVEQHRFVRRHFGAIDFAVTHLLRAPKGIRATVTMAVVARAWYTIDHDKLERFCTVLKTGVPETGESAAAVVGRFLIEQSSTGSSFEIEKYQKIERALKAFLDGEVLRKLYPATTEQFPLPEEEAHTTRRSRKK